MFANQTVLISNVNINFSLFIDSGGPLNFATAASARAPMRNGNGNENGGTGEHNARALFERNVPTADDGWQRRCKQHSVSSQFLYPLQFALQLWKKRHKLSELNAKQ